jgi:hypothetical protein
LIGALTSPSLSTDASTYEKNRFARMISVHHIQMGKYYTVQESIIMHCPKEHPNLENYISDKRQTFK